MTTDTEMTSTNPYPQAEHMQSGYLSCQGCGGSMIMRHCLKALGPDTICVIPACCWTIIAGNWPYCSLNIPVMHTAFETAGAAASGVRAALELKGKNSTHVLAFAGDGGTFDIGLQSLSGAVERNEDIIYVCYDNEAYMNTGIQRSSATPEMAWTTTTPTTFPKLGPKKNIIQILTGHKIPYCATANVAWPLDLIAKVRRAAETRGTTFIHVLSPCPPGWKISSEKSIEVARLATQTKVFPLYEVINGESYHINLEPENIPVEAYLRTQGRFSHLKKEDIAHIQQRVDYEWKILLQRSMMEPFHMNM
ncbi:MAG: pyruvate synthase subunit beta [Deltaproteobacteria bacterium]|jgi:pyruvate/2-oxoacid:ferredoxin oxidoreductase beta subunit|nr:pyruvate synthase subunit beta [Deltaproteobacteria bacterium]MBT4637938.1 pyruvate synthase subunit beta [Deltaproteobacteria bacterium]MBT6500776.1 pyruvate synthase subunit beta [Deltaproteobacteria bacterium]MBT6611267.1 pyruvate synthase subunit beta [Deltaproteobacteria bacterium]MBT7155831.1 pyruvate synthase subunit beta [Deltaproteobacteria bacterium]